MTMVNVSVVVKDAFADPTSDVGVNVSGYLGIASALQWYGEVGNIAIAQEKEIPTSA